MSRKQIVALKQSEKEPDENESRVPQQEIGLRWAEGIRNYEKLKKIFPWLEEDTGSYL